MEQGKRNQWGWVGKGRGQFDWRGAQQAEQKSEFVKCEGVRVSGRGSKAAGRVCIF